MHTEIIKLFEYIYFQIVFDRIRSLFVHATLRSLFSFLMNILRQMIAYVQYLKSVL